MIKCTKEKEGMCGVIMSLDKSSGMLVANCEWARRFPFPIGQRARALCTSVSFLLPRSSRGRQQGRSCRDSGQDFHPGTDIIAFGSFATIPLAFNERAVM
jgi:hypothetical protein